MDDIEDATERTPLLGRRSTDLSPQPALPSITSLENNLPNSNNTDFAAALSLNLVSLSLPSQSSKTALSLILTFRRYLKTHATGPVPQVYNNADSGRHLGNDAAALVAEWTDFVSLATKNEIDDVLWATFPLVEDKEGIITLMHVLVKPGIPSTISRHEIVRDSILNMWDHGRHLHVRESTAFDRFVSRLEAVVTPRVLHLLELGTLCVYLGTLAHSVLAPPKPPEIIDAPTAVDPRSIVLLVFSLSFVNRYPAWWMPAFILVWVACVGPAPALPHSESISYDLLVLTLCMHLLQSNTPYPPSPLFLFPSSKLIPLSTVLGSLWERVVLPALAFFAPLGLLFLGLLSLSMSDAYPFFSLSLAANAAPSMARVAFFLLLCVVAVEFICLLTSLVLIIPASAPPSVPAHAWDCYTPSIGLNARQVMVSIIDQYLPSPSRTFPAPLNLFQFVFVRFPRAILLLCGQKATARKLRDVVEPMLWRFTVLPISLIVSLVWPFSLIRKLGHNV